MDVCTKAKQFTDTMERVFLEACSAHTELAHSFRRTPDSRIFYSSFVHETITPPPVPEESSMIVLKEKESITQLLEEEFQPTSSVQDEDIPFVVIRKPRHAIHGFGDTESLTSTIQIDVQSNPSHKKLNGHNILDEETVAPRIKSVVDKLQILGDSLRKIEEVVDNPSFVYLAQQKDLEGNSAEKNKGDENSVSDKPRSAPAIIQEPAETTFSIGNPNKSKLEKLCSFSNEPEGDHLYTNHELWNIDELANTIETIGDNINIVDKSKGKDKIPHDDVTDVANMENCVEVWYLEEPTTSVAAEQDMNRVHEAIPSEEDEVDTKSQIEEDMLVQESVWGERIHQFVDNIPIATERVESTIRIAQNVITAGVCVIWVVFIFDRLTTF